MKKKLIIFSFLLSAGLLSACSGSSSKPGQDTARMWHATNPYRDTFATTSQTGDATTVDNSGSGGVKIVKPHGQPSAATEVDTTKK